jgi:hypothetical protein
MRREMDVPAVNADAERFSRRSLRLVAGQRGAHAMADFLGSLGVHAVPSADGAVIALDVRDEAAAREVYNGLVCFIVASTYRFDAEVMVLTASVARGGDMSSSSVT